MTNGYVRREDFIRFQDLSNKKFDELDTRLNSMQGVLAKIESGYESMNAALASISNDIKSDQRTNSNRNFNIQQMFLQIGCSSVLAMVGGIFTSIISAIILYNILK